MTEIVNLYLKELSNENSTKEESIELIKLARSGDEIARERLVKNYLLFVVKIAKEYLNMGVPIADLISQGNVGLLTAVEKYHLDSGAPFSACARLWIKQSIIRNCLHNRRLVRLPENVSELMRTDRWKGDSYHEVSIDYKGEEGETMADFMEGDDNRAFSTEEQMLIESKIKRLLSYIGKERDVEIVKACYGIGREKPLEIAEAAELFDLTTTRINQILRSSIQVMRKSERETPKEKSLILSARYGAEGNWIDVTGKVSEMFELGNEVKSSNKLGGDPCKGKPKMLVVEFVSEGETFTKKFPEGTIIII